MFYGWLTVDSHPPGLVSRCDTPPRAKRWAVVACGGHGVVVVARTKLRQPLHRVSRRESCKHNTETIRSRVLP